MLLLFHRVFLCEPRCVHSIINSLCKQTLARSPALFVEIVFTVSIWFDFVCVVYVFLLSICCSHTRIAIDSKTEINKHKQKVNDDKISCGKRGKEKMIEREIEKVCVWERERDIKKAWNVTERKERTRWRKENTVANSIVMNAKNHKLLLLCTTNCFLIQIVCACLQTVNTSFYSMTILLPSWTNVFDVSAEAHYKRLQLQFMSCLLSF